MIDYQRIERTAKYLCKRLPPNVDWQDLAQESAFAAFRGRKSIDGPMLDYLREKVSVVRTARYDEDPEREYVVCIPLRSRLNPVHMPDIVPTLYVLALLSKLPERKEMILTLAYWGGLTNREIAQAFGVVESRISVQRKEALAELQRMVA